MKLIAILTILLIGSQTVYSEEVYSEEAGKNNSDEKELKIEMRDGASISGTLAGSRNSSTIIILVSPPVGGNRNLSYEENSASRYGMFKVLSDNLVKEGYSVFRFDNRGVGKSTGNHPFITLHTHASDVLEIYSFLKNKKRQIGLIGYSEGGLVAGIVASKIKELSFLILLGTPGYGGWDALKYQVAKSYDSKGEFFNQKDLFDSLKYDALKIQSSLFDTLSKYSDTTKIRESFEAFFAKRDTVSESPSFFSNDDGWYQHLISLWMTPQQLAMRKFDPLPYYTQIRCPVLALIGSADHKVDAEPHLKKIESILKNNGNKNVTTFALKDVNHSFLTLNETASNIKDKTEQFSGEAIIKIISWLHRIERK